MFKHKSFNPKVIIVDHFDDVNNQIEIRTETIFSRERKHSKRHSKSIFKQIETNVFGYNLRHTTTKKHSS